MSLKIIKYKVLRAKLHGLSDNIDSKVAISKEWRIHVTYVRGDYSLSARLITTRQTIVQLKFATASLSNHCYKRYLHKDVHVAKCVCILVSYANIFSYKEQLETENYDIVYKNVLIIYTPSMRITYAFYMDLTTVIK